MKVSDNKLQKTFPATIKEKGQYFLAFGVIAAMLIAANFPPFVILFFGIFAYFLLKMFSAGSRNETREIFEFYLSANEILRDDERRWFGFEIQETIQRGENIIQRMSGAPPVVHFALGALYNKAGDHKAAVNHLAHVMENHSADESAYAYPSPELRNYVKVLRKIERDPADAPLTSAAVRSLERARKIRGKTLLEESRVKFANSVPVAKKELGLNGSSEAKALPVKHEPASFENMIRDVANETSPNGAAPREAKPEPPNGKRKSKKSQEEDFANRKPISEVLHDIYDKNIN